MTRTLTSQTTEEIQALLQQNLNELIADQVIGFTLFDEAFGDTRAPVDLKTLLGPHFNRCFDPTIKQAIQELKENNLIDKKQLHAFLIKKYFGLEIDDLSLDAIPSLQPNAACANAEPSSPDHQLHLHFLQSFRAFGILPQHRKYIASTATRDQEWLIDGTHDVTALFQNIMQLYILSDILEDYQKNNLFVDCCLSQDLLLALLANTKKLFEQKSQIISQFTNSCDIYHDGLFHDLPSINSDLDTLFPGILDLIPYYALGRLLFGSLSQDLRHANAYQNNSFANFNDYASYCENWLFAHLNLESTWFCLKLSIFYTIVLIDNYIDFINGTNAFEIDEILGNSLILILDSFIIISLPVLFIFATLSGITAMPFSILRLLLLPENIFITHSRRSKMIFIVDLFEFCKDIFLFYYCALPLMILTASLLSAVLSNLLVMIGTLISLIIVSIMFLMLGPFIVVFDVFNLNPLDILIIAAYNYLGSVAAVLAFILPAYFMSAFLIRSLVHFLSPEFSAATFICLMPFWNFYSRLINFFNNQWQETDLLTIAPQLVILENAATNISAPTSSKIPKFLREEAQKLMIELGMLRMALYLSPERKALLAQLIENLSIDDTTDDICLNASIVEAKSMLAYNFKPAEQTTLLKIYDQTESILSIEKLILAKHPPVYQPSWQAIETLRKKGSFASLGFTPETCAKLEAIAKLKKAVA